MKVKVGTSERILRAKKERDRFTVKKEAAR